MRIWSYKVSTHSYFDNFILVMIILSSIKLVFDTYLNTDSTENSQKTLNRVSTIIDIVLNVIFMWEALLKIISMGFFLDKGSYLRESWNVLDFIIVIFAFIDMCFESVDIPVIKILRLLRTLRPLRFISHNINLKIVVTSLIESVSAIINVLIVMTLIWLMFAILAINLLSKKMGYCRGVVDKYAVNYSQCLSMGLEWKSHDTNFDNIYTAMITLYVVSSLEGWPDIMYWAIDANDKEDGPKLNGNVYMGFFFVGFILIGSFFLLNLFVGVIFFNFQKAQK